MAQEINREALLIYLNNIRMLETMAMEYDKKVPQLTNKMDDLCKQKKEWEWGYNAPKAPEPPTKPSKKPKLLNDVNSFFLGFGLLLLLGGIYMIIDGEWYSFFGYLGILSSIIFIGLTASLYGDAIKEYEAASKAYLEEQKKYEKEMKTYPQNLDRYNRNKDDALLRLNDKISKISTVQQNTGNNISALKNDLQEAYSMNIIPTQFRNIQGIYYLYDYLSTSNESLTSALMQANLESIKQKLDQMIASQGAMIIQQAQANKILFEQNQQILETARGIENNTFVAAQYAKISAVNSTVSLRLQEQQLAYQEADYWLNV